MKQFHPLSIALAITLCSSPTFAFHEDGSQQFASLVNNNAPRCVKTYYKKDYMIFENTCRENVYVSYCGTSQKIAGKLCGDYAGDRKSTHGTYYTHSFNLKSGKKEEMWNGRLKGIRFAVCFGQTGFGKDVKDDNRGNYSCPQKSQESIYRK